MEHDHVANDPPKVKLKAAFPDRNLNIKRKLFLFAVVALAVSTAIFWKASQNRKPNAPKDTVILIIRHAEKPDTGWSLSSLGEARALAYVQYFKNFTIDGRGLKLDLLFATADSAGSHRPRLTLEPIAAALGLTIDHRFSNHQFLGLAREIQNLPPGSDILICWHHGTIPGLLSALGADPKKLLPNGQWPDEVFGWLIQLRYDDTGRLMETKRISENLTPADSARPVTIGP